MTEKSDRIIKELGYDIRIKPITTAPRTPDTFQIRDTFQTPKYAVDLLVPYIPKNIKHIWECAAGEGRLGNRLMEKGYAVSFTDIRAAYAPRFNFITDEYTNLNHLKQIKSYSAIITNPPFSIKDLFIEKAFEYGLPFAFLINADYSGKTIEWTRRGCEKIVPTSRIAFITPNILRRIHEGEIWNIIKKFFSHGDLGELKENNRDLWEEYLEAYDDTHNYKTIDEAPQELLYKYSSAQFHSMWLTYGFNIGRTETFVDLTVEQRKGNI